MEFRFWVKSNREWVRWRLVDFFPKTQYWNPAPLPINLSVLFQVDHTYDRSFVMNQLTELEELLVNLIQPHLTDKSVGRVDQVSDVLGVFLGRRGLGKEKK